MFESRFQFGNFGDDPRFRGVASRVRGYPGWVWKYAILITLVVIFFPTIMWVLGLVLTFVVAFAALVVLHTVFKGFNAIFKGTPRTDADGADGRDGRRNVRIVDP